jgi:UDP-N-acetylglucosamine 3-dehydrogenase
MESFSRLRIGLIGCGAFGESHLAAFAAIPHARITAVTDIAPDRAHRAAERHGIPHVARDFHELVAMPEVDAVSVVTTEAHHLQPVLAALEQGKHVFVEKPMATNVEDAQQMIDAAAKRGLILMPGHLLRFEPKYATVKAQLTAGRLGRILSMYTRRNRPKWQGRIYKRTPLVLETAIHDIDTMLWYAGAKVESVWGWEVSAEAGTQADLFCGVLRFEGGAVGMLQTSWMLPDKTPFLDDSMQVMTTSGVANIDVLNSGLTLWTEDGAEGPDVSYEPRLFNAAYGALREELSYFALCGLENRQPAILTAGDGLEAVRVSLALVQAAAEGHEIRL